jgi:two-component system sensor histidine kinase YesM
VEEILSGNTGSKGGTNIAVYNTHRRLEMLYGPEYGLTYRSKQGEGTEVEIRIPSETGKVV